MNMSDKPEPIFYFVKDKSPVCAVVISEPPFPPEVYSEVSSPANVRDIPEKQYEAVLGLIRYIKARLGTELTLLTEDEQTDLPCAVLGKTKFNGRDQSPLGDAGSASYFIGLSGNDLVTSARTPGGYLDAIRQISASLVITERDAYIPSSAMHVYERVLPETHHVFDHFTISIYGSPGHEEDDRVFEDLVSFGIDRMPLTVDPTDQKSVERTKALIRKFSERGITVRLYGNFRIGEKDFLENHDTSKAERQISLVTKLFGMSDGVAEWGFFDEPETRHFEYCALVKRLLERYDPKKRPVYINLGPRAHCRGVQTFYDRYAEIVKPDYFCLDRYPFFQTERGAEMNDDYFYSHLELNRNNAIDNSVDSGLILAAIRVGNDPLRADITEDFMRWQTQMALAYGVRYLEQYVYYYVHESCILGPGLVPTFRWHIAKNADSYLHAASEVLTDRRLDAVFHLSKPDGTYDIDTIPFYPYRGISVSDGCDAVLSFFSDNIVVITDKRCDDSHGGCHNLTIDGLTDDTAYYDACKKIWQSIDLCPALVKKEKDRLGKDGLCQDSLTFCLTRSSQLILRR